MSCRGSSFPAPGSCLADDVAIQYVKSLLLSVVVWSISLICSPLAVMSTLQTQVRFFQRRHWGSCQPHRTTPHRVVALSIHWIWLGVLVKGLYTSQKRAGPLGKKIEDLLVRVSGAGLK